MKLLWKSNIEISKLFIWKITVRNLEKISIYSLIIKIIIEIYTWYFYTSLARFEQVFMKLGKSIKKNCKSQIHKTIYIYESFIDYMKKC